MGRRLNNFLIEFFALLVFAVPTHGQSLSERVVEHRLPNGLTVLLYTRHQAPIVACRVHLKVGSANDTTGQTGIAHITEHIAFKGTPTLGTTDYDAEKALLDTLDQLWQQIVAERDRGDQADLAKLEQLYAEFDQTQQTAGQYVISEAYSQLIEEQGGVGLNAATTRDATQYFVSLPANRLELWMMLQADLLLHTVPREFYQERDVILEERQMRTDASPIGTLVEQFLGAAFIAHPYGFPAIGWESDIQDITPAQLMDFFNRYYTPSNMVVTIVGDIDPPAVLKLAEHYFGQLPARPSAPPLRTVEPPQPGERRVEVEWDASPYLVIGYHRPALTDADAAVFEVIAMLLSGGRTGRLYKHLVEEQQLAIQIETLATFPGERYPTLFLVAGVPMESHTLTDLETAVFAELERLATEPVTAWELAKAQNMIEASFLDTLSSNSGLAEQLAMAQSLFGDWRALEQRSEQIKAVTADDILRVAAAYFTKQNRTVGWLVTK